MHSKYLKTTQAPSVVIHRFLLLPPYLDTQRALHTRIYPSSRFVRLIKRCQLPSSFHLTVAWITGVRGARQFPQILVGPLCISSFGPSPIEVCSYSRCLSMHRTSFCCVRRTNPIILRALESSITTSRMYSNVAGWI